MGANQGRIQSVAGPGAWNDPDQLTVGDDRKRLFGERNGLNPDESQTTMAMWAIWASPLLMSNDLRTVKPWAKEILLNREVIAVNQDVLGIQGTKIFDNMTMGNTTITTCRSAAGPGACRARVIGVHPVGGSEVWAKPLSGGDVAIVLYNKGDDVIDISVQLSDVAAFNSSARGLASPLMSAKVRDLFTGREHIATFNVTARAVPPHGSRMLRLSAAPSRWIPNNGTAKKSIVVGSSGSSICCGTRRFCSLDCRGWHA